MHEDSEYLDKAKRFLNYRYEGIETAYKKAQRLNNLGLCEMLLRRYNNAFHYFSKAFHIYAESTELKLMGLVKNIIAVYKHF
jgi:tetratricopeptide (TPR) repeat protein